MIEPNAPAMPAETDPEERFWGSYERGISLTWTVVMYMVAAAGLYDTYIDNRQAMGGWPLAGLIALLAGYFVLYHWFFAGGGDVPLGRIVLYGSTQLAIVMLLARYNPSFVGLLYAVLAHLLVTLPYRRWALPIGVALLVVYFFWGVHDNLIGGNWDDAFYIMLTPLTWILVFASIATITRKSYEQSETVRQLRRARAQLEASAAQAEELAVLRERARLAREMHDSIGHALVVVNVKLEAAQRLYHRDQARGDAELEATRELVRETMTDLRSSLAGLRAPLTTHHDLAAALRSLVAEATARTKLHVVVDVAPDLPALDPRAAETLWRVAREALANVERHAGAASATVALERRGDALLLRVVDDGVGISAADRRKPGHYGLLGMRERLEALGGRLTIRNGASGGTVVEAALCNRASAPRVPLGSTSAEHTVRANDAQDAA